MTGVTLQSEAPPLGAALRHAMVLLAPAASIFAVGALLAGLVFSDPAMGRTALVLAVGAGVFAFASQLLKRGLVRAAAFLLTVTLLVLPIFFAAVQPPSFASFPLVPLLGVAFALPFLEGRRLAALMAMASLSAAATAAIQSIGPRYTALPDWFFAIFNVLGLLALLVVFLILLAAFSNRLHRSLRQATESTVALAHQATHDSLTGLANRQAGLAQAQSILDGAAGQRAGSAVLYIDIDEFKRINDTLGHLAGDALLERVGRRIAAASSSAVTARPGGDEFVVVVGPADEDAARRVAIAITDALTAPFNVRGRAVRITASIGIARIEEATRAEEILARADAAMYTAKRAGKGQTAIFDPAMFAELQARLDLEGELRQALESNKLRLEYQPIIDLATGWIVDLEALLRWDHPSGRHVGPAEFIPIAEESGLIVPIGRFVLKRALADLQVLEKELGPARRPMMSVNLSACQLSDPGIVDAVRTTLADTGLAGSALRLEITETAMLVGVESAAETIAALRSLGASIVIDDFGTGYSALDYLKRLVVDGVKIDRSFVAGLGRLGPDEAIVTAAIAFAHALGLEVTGEGIETRAQLDRLTELGCDRGQGYLTGRPAPIEEVLAILRADLHGRTLKQVGPRVPRLLAAGSLAV
jgi:diguanylate cyclase (GGDEF)-like protein